MRMPDLQSAVLLLRRFRSSERGVAAVEFALILPLLLLLYFGSMEAAALFTADKRVNSVSATIGDLTSQWDPDDGKLPTATLTDYFYASTGIIAPYSTVGLKIVVSLVQVKVDGTTKVLWSKANPAGTARATNSSFSELASGTEMNAVARGGCIIAAEVAYPYAPLLAQVIDPVTLNHINYFLPRFGSSVALNLQDTSLATGACTAA